MGSKPQPQMQYQINVEMISGSFDYEQRDPPAVLRLATLCGAEPPSTAQVIEAVMQARETWDAVFGARERESQQVTVDLFDMSGMARDAEFAEVA